MKIICVGRNYAGHIKELANERPTDPVLFLKPDTAILPDQQDFYIPEFSNDIHYEVEVLVKISKPGKHISEKFAPKYYEEIGLGIDFTARDVQAKLKEKGLPWEKAKAFDGSAVVGEFFPKEEMGDLNNLPFTLQMNDSLAQNGNTSLMLWKIDEIIAYISSYFTLRKGDIIFTGTPAGVGSVKPGDILVGAINNKNAFKVTVR